MSSLSALGVSMFSVFGNMTLVLVVIVFLAIEVVGMWKVFTKAGEPGWGSIIPIYNTIFSAR